MFEQLERTDYDYFLPALNAYPDLLVIFWYEETNGCHLIEPVVTELAGKLSIPFFQSNTDNDPYLARRYRVSSVPTIIRFKDGRELTRLVGFFRSEQIVEALELSEFKKEKV